MRNREKSYVLITGASSGIGACFAKRFAKEGYSLILTARRMERLEQLRDELINEILIPEPKEEETFKPVEITEDSEKQDICLIAADLSTTKGVEELFEKIEDKNLFIFINNAGFGDCGYFMDTDVEKELSMIDVNVKAMHLGMKLALKKLEQKNRGYILNVASSAGLLPAGPYMATYYATKAYVTSLTRAVATELKQKGSNIYLGALCPGPVDTEFNDVANVEFSLKGITPEYCANYAVDQMKKREVIIVPTLSIKMAVGAGKVVPTSLLVNITARQQKKKLGE